MHRAGWIERLLSVAVWCSGVCCWLMGWMSIVRRACHGPTRHSRNAALFVNSRFRVHSSFGSNMSQLRVVGRLRQVVRSLRSRKIADQVQVLSTAGSDGEGLLHQAIRLVPVAVWSAVLVCLSSAYAISVRSFVKTPAASLAFHLAVCQEAARDTARAPRLAVRPSSHSSFSLIPDEHRAGSDRLPLFLR